MRHFAILLCLFGLSSTDLSAKIPENLEGTEKLEDFVAASLKAREEGSDLSAEELLAASHAARRVANNGEALAFAEAALEKAPKNSLAAARAHRLLSQTSSAKLLNQRSLEHGHASLEILKKKKDSPEIFEERFRTLAALGWASDSETLRNKECLSYWEKAGQIASDQAEEQGGSPWKARHALALAQQAYLKSRMRGTTVDDSDKKLIEQAVGLAGNLDRAKLTKVDDRYAEAEALNLAGVVLSRYHSKSSPLQPSPQDYYEQATAAAEDIVSDYPHNERLNFALLVYRTNITEQEDKSTSANGSQSDDFEDSVEAIVELVKKDPSNLGWLAREARFRQLLFWEIYEAKAYEDALEQAEKALAIRMKLIDPETGGEVTGDRLYQIGVEHRNRSYAFSRLQRSDDMNEAYGEAASWGKKSIDHAPGDLIVTNWYSSVSGYWARSHQSEDPKKAADIYGEESTYMEKSAKVIGKVNDHSFHSNIGSAYAEQARILETIDDFDDRALISELYREATEHRAESVEIRATCSSCNRYLWKNYHNWAASKILEMEDANDVAKLREAIDIVEEAIEAAEEKLEVSGTVGTYANKALGTLQPMKSQLLDLLPRDKE